MRAYKILIAPLLIFCHISIAQDFVSDSIVLKSYSSKSNLTNAADPIYYADSLSKIYSDNLLTVFISTTLHEFGSNIRVEHILNEGETGEAITDSKGRFFIRTKTKPSSVRIQISEKDYYAFDSVYSIENFKTPISIILKPKYKISLRGRAYSGSYPIENVQVDIKYKEANYTLSTLGCYTDEEEYWNCLYLGMFKQTIVFEDPNDSLEITLHKDGFKDSYNKLQLKDFDGDVVNYKLKYAHELKESPKHNIALKFGFSYEKTWSVAMTYMRQLKIGNFNRLALGLEGSLLTNNITSEHSTFNDLPLAEAEDSYSLGMIGPRIGLSLSNPKSRHFNTSIGLSIPYQFSQTRIGIHPYIASKYYIDLNKALFIELKYIDYTLNVSEYTFDTHGNADISKELRDYQKLLINFGLLISL